MFQLELSNEEQEVLVQVLQRALAALDLEILHTDHREFKAFLKQRREVLQRLVAKLPKPAAAAA